MQQEVMVVAMDLLIVLQLLILVMELMVGHIIQALEQVVMEW
jgi:hypothetical protein